MPIHVECMAQCRISGVAHGRPPAGPGDHASRAGPWRKRLPQKRYARSTPTVRGWMTVAVNGLPDGFSPVVWSPAGAA